jgi:hypothetical protein
VAADAFHQVVGAEELDPLRLRVEETDQREAEDDEEGHKDRGQGEVEGEAPSGAPGGHFRRRSVV